jgi:hypothetical protein
LDELKDSIASDELILEDKSDGEIASNSVMNNQGKPQDISEWRKLQNMMIKNEDGMKKSVVTKVEAARAKKDKKSFKSNKEVAKQKSAVNESYEEIQVELFDDQSQMQNAQLPAMNKSKSHKLKKSTGEAAKNSQTLIVDEVLISQIEKSGFTKPYIIASLNNDDMNHVTTFYYLLKADIEY